MSQYIHQRRIVYAITHAVVRNGYDCRSQSRVSNMIEEVQEWVAGLRGASKEVIDDLDPIYKTNL
jgi:hypothetical protein